MSDRSYGWRRHLPDQRDHLFSLAEPSGVALPPSIDLRLTNDPPIYDQGALSSCTANAIADLLEHEHLRLGELDPPHPSRLFLYYITRDLEGWPDRDIGAYLRDGFKALRTSGICPESEWPYDHLDTRVNQRPPDECYLNAVNFETLQYRSLPQALDALKGSLVAGLPFVFGFSVYESFESAEVAATGLVPLPLLTERLLGGHAVICLGYEDNTRSFLCRNSWGTGWGLPSAPGHFLLPYDYVTNPNLAADFWGIAFVP